MSIEYIMLIIRACMFKYLRFEYQYCKIINNARQYINMFQDSEINIVKNIKFVKYIILIVIFTFNIEQYYYYSNIIQYY